MKNDMTPLAIALPEDIEKAKWCGDFTRAKRLIAQRLESPKTPKCLCERLALEQVIIDRLPLDYTYTEDEGFSMICRDIPDFTREEFDALMDSSAIDWIYIDGKPTLCRKFYDTLLKVHPDIGKRAGKTDEDDLAEKRLIDETVRLMKETGKAGYHIRLRASLRINDEDFCPGEELRVHMPIPTDACNMKNIKVLSTSPEGAQIAPPDALQRTVFFTCAPKENMTFTVEYEYDSVVERHELNPAEVSSEQPHFDTEELLPHIQFTPFIRALCAELKGDERNPLIIARRFYDYCTTVVTYSFMREYFTITEIADYAGLGQKGDCGIQAILFITLCRCAGIPARWQSGLFVTPYSQGSHDWAQFYIAPYGWLFADPSFGGSAYRAGNMERHNHYFGSLDPFRMAANSAFQAELTPPKTQLRIDPYDNQRGEIESDQRGLLWTQVENGCELIEMTKL